MKHLLAIAIVSGAAACAAAEDNVYLFSYFLDNGQDGLHLAASKDGLQFDALAGGRALLAPQAGENDKLMRDPCIARGPDGVYHLVWTTSWNDRGIGYAHSTDLIHWSEQRYLPVMKDTPGTKNCWAPELFYDAANARWLIFWASTVEGRVPLGGNPEGQWNHRMYFTATPNFVSFTPSAIFYDHGFSVIDATVVQTPADFVMILKNETRVPPEKNLRLARAASPAGPWPPPSAPITGKYWAEGPSAIRHKGQWRVYFDRYVENRMGLIVSTDLETWEDWTGRVHFPKGARHGTVFAVPAAAAEAIDRAPAP